MSQRHSNIASRSNTPRHGHVFSPASRAWFEWEAGRLDEGALNQRESGKFFPHILGGLTDAFAKDDDKSVAPPPDGKIASAGQLTGAQLDAPGSHWTKHDVRSGETLDISWDYSARHKTRRWNYFLTKEGWDPDKVLSRDQFEAAPFYTVQINLQPHWSYGEEMMPPKPTTHPVPLPTREGYHVMLAVWEVANTSMAFYQVVDLNFLPHDGGGERPEPPTGLTAENVTDKQVSLKWNAATGPRPIASYRITRNGALLVQVDAPLLIWSDNSVEPDTQYNYAICAIDDRGTASAPSRPVQVHTLPEGGEGPTAPTDLHSMGSTEHSISLMWGRSVGNAPIVDYLIFRDEKQIKSVSANQTAFEDTGLTPDTEFRYTVKARDVNDRLSSASNVLIVSTQGAGGGHPAWKLNALYETNELVSHNGGIWRCLQKHTSYTADWAPGLESSEVLWVKHP
ncbi:GlcNAc-binding protein A [Pseudomonas fluorescens]|uniref:GlcNAc-binding protein A n=1 Tax=Pseudomonas fluorescens TaxID=294 RepID=A0A5E7PBW7_PSEFL|nr:lytic polysaccharide monooxygenase [Pseudomonas fluorescens]VVP47074.1 GlcNAc-binding protein A [Pseudomonas fluorescens]